MLPRYGLTYCVLLLIASLSISCRSVVNEPSEPNEPIVGTIVLVTDSDEWKVYVSQTNVLASDPISVDSPYHIPTRDEAKILRTISYGSNDQRYLTDDGYTFGMPSAAVTKAGAKTRYSVLGLWRRPLVIDIPF